jgi:hypothetical protein
MSEMPQYFGIMKEIEKLRKLPADATLKRSDLESIIGMFFQVLEKHHAQIKALENKLNSPKGR